MGKKDPRIDAYIAKAAPFARPILNRLRKVVHAGCPAVEEGMKWNFPHFMYEGILCSMAAFKQHCSFGFWKGTLMKSLAARGTTHEAMGQLGRIESLGDLPSDEFLIAQVKEAMRLNETGAKAPTKHPSKAKQPLVVPSYLKAALKKNSKAAATFAGFSPSHQREYVEWITEARTDATRQKRLTTAIEWMAEGKSRHWKYARK
jgi:uncharacterized protein YdeI (YjbR/CyaY-like superfamily)